MFVKLTHIAFVLFFIGLPILSLATKSSEQSEFILCVPPCIAGVESESLELSESRNQLLFRLKQAIANNNKDLIKEIAEQSHIMNTQNQEGRTFLHEAIAHQEWEVAEVLLNFGKFELDLNIEDAFNETPLFTAISRDPTDHQEEIYLRVIDRLLSFGADPNKTRSIHNIFTPLQYAELRQKEKVVKLLIEKGAKFLPTNLRKVPSRYFSKRNELKPATSSVKPPEQSEFILCVPPCIAGVESESLELSESRNQLLFRLKQAIANNNKDLIKEIAEQIYTVNAKNQKDQTFLHEAISRQEWETAEILLNIGLMKMREKMQKGYTVNTDDINYKDISGNTPLMTAVIKDPADHQEEIYLRVIDRLLSFGADPDIHASSLGYWTALHEAVSVRKVKVVKLLVEKGAKIHPRDVDGNTPRDYAKRENDLEIIDILDKAEREKGTCRSSFN